MLCARFFAGAVCALGLLTRTDAKPSTLLCAGVDDPLAAGAAAKASATAPRFQPSVGHLHVLVVFAGFADQSRDADSLAGLATALLDPQRPGSLSHFYDTMSFGQLQLSGTVLPRRYVSGQPASAYVADAAGQYGRYGQFALEILEQVDADIDLSRFDSDGPDGVPASGDDDGRVDYVFLVLASMPEGFILGRADGIANLGFEDYVSQDAAAARRPTRFDGSQRHGSIVRQGTFSQTVGSMAHEFGHALGLPDLYDHSDSRPKEDSAGIGAWGLMGWGAHGWNGDDGPNPLSAWSLQMLGWIGRDNDRLVSVDEDLEDAQVADLRQGGSVYRIPLRTRFLAETRFVEEYLLLESRHRGGYYDRNAPGEGLLVWHVRPDARNNQDEERKLVDLVCADGLADRGGDDLDRWAHDEEYAAAQGGNRGDGSDPFDGVRYRQFRADWLPAASEEGSPTVALEPLALRDIRRKADAVHLDIRLPRWSGRIEGQVRWFGSVVVDGDVTVAPGAELVIYGGTHVRFDGTDRLAAGTDPLRCELLVEGTLEVIPGPLYRRGSGHAGERLYAALARTPAVLEALGGERTWHGIVSVDSARIAFPPSSLVVQDARSSGAAGAATVAREAGVDTAAFRLQAGYPNPFNAATTIRFALPASGHVELSIFNGLGQIVRTLVSGHCAAGTQSVVWDGRDDSGQAAASGVYFVRLDTQSGLSAVGRLTLAR